MRAGTIPLRWQASALHLLLFFSGAAGLGYEIAWTRMLSVAVGHEIIAVLAVVREPLLEVVRISPDFDTAYRPLLAMAKHLVLLDPEAGKALLQQLIDANPARPEAPSLLRTFPIQSNH